MRTVTDFLKSNFYFYFSLEPFFPLFVTSPQQKRPMPRPGKQLQHLQRIAEGRRMPNQAVSVARADDEAFLDTSSDEDIQDYIVIEDPAVAALQALFKI